MSFLLICVEKKILTNFPTLPIFTTNSNTFHFLSQPKPPIIHNQLQLDQNQPKIMKSSFAMLRSFSTDTQSHSNSSPAAATPPKNRKMNKGFSFHQKQQQSVKDPMEGSALLRQEVSNKKAKNLTRRWSSLKQYETTNLSQQSLVAGGSSVSSTNPSPQNLPSERNGNDVKKKWEVIEHYKGATNGRDTISSSLLAVSNVFEIFLTFFPRTCD